MNVAFIVSTPHQVHVFRNAARILEGRGNGILFLSRDYGITEELLRIYGLPFVSLGRARPSLVGKAFEHAALTARAARELRRFKADVVLGDSLLGHAASLTRLPSVCFADGDNSALYSFLYRRVYTSRLLCTPRNFRIDIGRRHLRYPGFQELAYLDPSRYRPDASIYDFLGISKGERFVLLRFNAFDAVSHDFGLRGLTVEMKRDLVREMQKEAHVVISSEAGLPDDLKHLAVRFPVHRIHDALAHADLVFAETAMVSEAAVLGTPAIFLHPLTGDRAASNFLELEERGLLRCFSDASAATAAARDLLSDRRNAELWARNRERLLEQCIDVTGLIVGLAEIHAAGGRPRAADVDLRAYGRAAGPAVAT